MDEQNVIIYERIWKDKIEYFVIPDGVTCGHPDCGGIQRCVECKRLHHIGEAKIKTGRKLLHD